MRNLRARSLVSVATLAFALALVGCSSDDTDGGAAASTTSSTSTVAPPEATTVEEVLALDRPVVLAHAGGENAHPHSTPYAYAESVAAGVDVLDVDVRLTGDGVLVVHHDEDVDRTTDSTGDVADMTFDELHALDNAFWFTEACSACTDQPRDAYVLRGVRTGEVEPPEGYEPDDFAVMAFEDLVEAYPDHVLNIEIKGAFPDDVAAAEELARILTEHDRLDASIVTAFDDQLAEAFHELAPDVAITPGLEAMTAYVLANEPLAEGRTIVQIPPDYEGIEVLTPELVERAHADGLVLWIWPNSREWENADGYTELLDMGVDGLNAADPPTAVEVVRGRS
jgi:glycerophosphoryl diester phosphodiesterase